MENSAIFKKIVMYKSQLDLTLLDDLDPPYKFLLHQLVNDFNESKTAVLCKLQGLLDIMYEKVNIGNWREAKLVYRKCITVVSYLKLLEQLKNIKCIPLTSQDGQNLYETIDYGLLFGYPLEGTSDILHRCAEDINQTKITDPLSSQTTKVNSEAFETTYNIPQKCIPLTVKNSPSMEMFYTECVLPCQPFILDNCIKHWPALRKWKDENYLLQLAGMRTVPIEIGSKYTDSEWTQKLMTMEDFIKSHILKTNDTVGYLAQYQLFQHIPELMKDIEVPEYCYFSETDSEIDINAWYGPKGTISPMHFDPKKNLLAQVVGFKQITIFSPSDTKFLYPHTDELLCNTAQVDPKNIDLTLYPKFVDATPFTCILKPGQMLYIPPNWWHYVESLSTSFSVSFWWD